MEITEAFLGPIVIFRKVERSKPQRRLAALTVRGCASLPGCRAYEIHTRGAALDNCVSTATETERGRQVVDVRGRRDRTGLNCAQGPDKAEKGGSVSPQCQKNNIYPKGR